MTTSSIGDAGSDGSQGAPVDRVVAGSQAAAYGSVLIGGRGLSAQTLTRRRARGRRI